jgi:Predicted integral membrane protein (DUF2269)
VSLDDWLLFLHVAAAFAVVAAVTVFTILIVLARKVDRPAEMLAVFRIGDPAAILVQAGSVTALLVGIWLAIRLPNYHPWDLWLLGAYVLWLAAGAFGAMSGKAYEQIRKRARELVAEGRLEPNEELREALRTTNGRLFHVLTSVSVFGILVLMIFKPGA